MEDGATLQIAAPGAARGGVLARASEGARGSDEERAGAAREATATSPIVARWLGHAAYRDAWALQHALVEARAAGAIPDQLLLLEHEPVLTIGRHGDESHVRATPDDLARRGIELIRIERGGEVTYHGPGQLTAYPIVKLTDRGLLIRPFVRALEAGLVEAAASFGVAAHRREGFPGCWIGDPPRKIGAVGVRVERGVSYHGVALNVDVRLVDFDLIDACGMPDVESTSIDRELGRTNGRGEPSLDSVGLAAAAFARAFAAALRAPLLGALPPDADPLVTRRELDALIGVTPAATASGGEL